MAAHETIFDNGSGCPADLLNNAAAVAGFLKDISPALTYDEYNLSAFSFKFPLDVKVVETETSFHTMGQTMIFFKMKKTLTF